MVFQISKPRLAASFCPIVKVCRTHVTTCNAQWVSSLIPRKVPA